MNAEQFKNDVLPVKDKLYRLALGMLLHPADAQDAIQEVLMKIWRQGNALKKIENLEAWAMRVTKNHCLDRLRSRHRRTVELEEHLLPIMEESNPQQEFEQQEIVSRIHELMQQLPEKHRLVMQLRDIEGMTYKEIAEILDMTLAQVKTNLFRARQRMQQLLTERKKAV